MFKRRMALRSRLGVVLTMAGVCVLIGRVSGHAYVAAVALGAMALLGVVLPWVVVRALRVRVVSTSERVRAGECVEVTMSIKSHWPTPLAGVTVRGSGGASNPVEPMVIFVRPGDQVSTIQIRTTRRGVLKLKDLSAGTSMPFGLFDARRPVEGETDCVIWPTPANVDDVVLLPEVGMSPTDVAESRLVASSGEPAGLRPYRRGDSMRSIHWQQTSRQGRLIVRERTAAERKRCRVTLDTRATSYTDAPEFEHAVSIATGVVELACAQGWLVVMQWPGTMINAGGSSGVQEALDALARVELTDTTPDPARDSGLFITGRRGADGGFGPSLLRAGGARLNEVAA